MCFKDHFVISMTVIVLSNMKTLSNVRIMKLFVFYKRTTSVTFLSLW